MERDSQGSGTSGTPEDVENQGHVIRALIMIMECPWACKRTHGSEQRPKDIGATTWSLTQLA
jgi:hypothetical protein